MNFSSLLIEFLNKSDSATLPGFGTFYLKNTNAVMNNEEQSILPPSKEILFSSDYDSKNKKFIDFVSAQKNIPEIDAEIEIKKQINFWNANLHKNQELVVENIGTFSLTDGKIHFTGTRTENLSPDFYGLEEINISEIKNSKNSKKEGRNYQFSKTVYWLVPLVLGILGLTYFGISQPEKIFGKKSFGNGFDKKTVPTIKKDTVQIDSTAVVNPALDSAKTDSTHSAAIIPKVELQK